ncbi:hypothetical protein OH784_08555 [Ectobacillus funiculus]|uniref:hypothetical protein n=1 Tax=Ectobacillus funiculus TaxID=137993 RepID=UPI00397B97AE
MNFEAGLQRSTVYNNAATLKRYIEERIREVKEDILSIHRTTKQQEEMEFLRSYLEKLQLRMVKEEGDTKANKEILFN